MKLSIFYKIFACILCFLIINFVHPSTNTQLKEDSFVVRITNEINSKTDSVALCKNLQNIKLSECKELNITIPLNNPISIAKNQTHLFIANYGIIKISGTSFILKCSIPKINDNQMSCQSILALVSPAHITGMTVIKNKLLFVESFSYSNNINLNYLIACDLPDSDRISNCNERILLQSLTQNPQTRFNTSMPITISNNDIYISDNAGNTVFKCNMTNALEYINCEAFTFEDAIKMHPENFTDPTFVKL